MILIILIQRDHSLSEERCWFCSVPTRKIIPLFLLEWIGEWRMCLKPKKKSYFVIDTLLARFLLKMYTAIKHLYT